MAGSSSITTSPPFSVMMMVFSGSLISAMGGVLAAFLAGGGMPTGAECQPAWRLRPFRRADVCANRGRTDQLGGCDGLENA